MDAVGKGRVMALGSCHTSKQLKASRLRIPCTLDERIVASGLRTMLQCSANQQTADLLATSSAHSETSQPCSVHADATV